MENFYKITKAEADLIGKFEYFKNQIFDPYCGEQADGTFLISEKSFLLLKDREEIKRVDFSSKTLFSESQLNTKKIPI